MDDIEDFAWIIWCTLLSALLFYLLVMQLICQENSIDLILQIFYNIFLKAQTVRYCTKSMKTQQELTVQRTPERGFAQTGEYYRY